MKPVCVGDEVLREIQIPRRNRRGLIEARRAAGVGASSSGEIPRRNRRGLIEAPGPRTRRPRRPEFPGEIAGASLKPARALRAGGSRTEFPGEIAGASLKLRGVPPAMERRRNSPAKSPGPH